MNPTRVVLNRPKSRAAFAPQSLALGLFILLLTCPSAPATPLNVLFFGNSFLMDYGGPATVPELFAQIATLAGHETPHVANLSFDGADFAMHLTYTAPFIASVTPPGEHWDYVVLQDHSTAPTTLGDLAAHRANAVALFQAVAAHSPGVVPVLFQTWARGPAHEFYTVEDPPFPGGPVQMTQQLHDGYAASAQDINASAGQSLARVAAVGDAFMNVGFPAIFYDAEQYHASPLGSLAAAAITYATVYQDPHAFEIDLGSILETMELGAGDGTVVTNALQTVVVPEPGAGVSAAAALLTLGLWAAKRRRAVF